MAEPWRKGDEVPETATYVCKLCSQHEEFQIRSIFPKCPSCGEGDPTEVWVRAS